MNDNLLRSSPPIVRGEQSGTNKTSAPTAAVAFAYSNINITKTIPRIC